ncbi:hypothetical protein CRM22_008066 [Opisthorchis felineus]|uniref:Uncharacterized protein n=1 Tax=Opisthorchis felineus TaxID=147828 RepID=A0A4S2LCU3_OPIFE|nr:hypothetical protein CRM22_008066 [Opisthorchis felineus]
MGQSAPGALFTNFSADLIQRVLLHSFCFRVGLVFPLIFPFCKLEHLYPVRVINRTVCTIFGVTGISQLVLSIIIEETCTRDFDGSGCKLGASFHPPKPIPPQQCPVQRICFIRHLCPNFSHLKYGGNIL